MLSKYLSAVKVSRIRHGLVCTEKVVAEGRERQRVVVEVSNGKAGVRKGDVLVKVGRLAVQNCFDVERALWGYKAGDQVEAAVMRGGKLTKVSLTLSGAETRVTSASSRGR